MAKQNYSILSSWINESWETLDKTKQRILNQAKADIFEVLVEDKKANRNDLAYALSENRDNNWKSWANRWFPEWTVKIGDKEYKIDQNKYASILDEYKKALNETDQNKREKDLKDLDTKLAERLILDSWDFIEFKDEDNFDDERSAKEESKKSYEELNKNVDEYKGKIEWVQKKGKNGDYYVIKRTDDQLKIIKARYNELLKKERSKKGEKTKRDNLKRKLQEKNDEIKSRESELSDKEKTISELTERLNSNNNGESQSETWDNSNENNNTQSETWNDENNNHEQWSLKYKEKQIQLLEQENAKLKVQLRQMSGNIGWLIMVEWQEIKITQHLIDATQRQIDKNNEKIKKLKWIENENWNTLNNHDDDDEQWSTETWDDDNYEQKERVATISNVSQVNRAIIQREADEELRQRYRDTSWFNFVWKANLFLRRKFIKDRIVNRRMWGRRWMDWSDASQAAADRHQIEEQNNLAERMQVVISDIDSANYPETRRRLDDLLWRLTWRANTVPPRQREISDTNFQTEFQSILNMSWRVFDRTRPGTATSTNWRPISEIIRSNNIWQLSTNILMQANKFREQQFLTRSIADHIARNPLEDDATFDNYCRSTIKQYIDSYNDMPDFLEQTGVRLDNTDASREIKRLQAHNWALTMIAAQSLKIRIQMLDDGWEAYNVRKEWGLLTKIWRFFDDPTWWENTKFGRRMNKHQNLKEAFWWIRWATKLWMMMTPAFLLAPMWPLAVASWVWGMSFLTTLIKKKAHYERENRSYQRMQATNLNDYRNKRAALANEVAGMHWYEGRFWWEKARIRKQYKDYVLTTQDQLSLSPDLLSRIERRLQDSNALNNTEQLNLAADLADGLARLDYHRRTGQNFLWSNNPWNAEREYRALQNAVMWWAKRLGIQVNDLRTSAPYDAYYHNTITLIEEWTGNDFDNQWYLRARRRFRTRSNTKAWYWAFKAWAISFGLSYLASSLASGNKTTTQETTKNVPHGQEWWEYNLWDMQEHLFVKGDLNPTMNSVINNSTSEITWSTLYSSVDSVRCSAAKWAAELAAAKADLAGALSNPVVAWNPDLVSAINNYVTEATTKIWMVPWLSVWNHDLAIARAIEAAKEWILEPIITSWNTAVAINPTCLHWANGWIQSSTWAVGQAFRNMGILNIDLVQKWTEQVVEQVTRAIPIPVGLNTFGTPRSEVTDSKAA